MASFNHCQTNVAEGHTQHFYRSSPELRIHVVVGGAIYHTISNGC